MAKSSREEELAAQDARSSVSCQVCGLHVSKYRCPGCAARTCSLKCSKDHKVETGCTGKRSRTDLTQASAFGERQMFSDCRFLEDAAALLNQAYALENSSQKGFLFRSKRRAGLPKHLANLVRAAKAGGIDLQIFPQGMERRRMNSSFCYGKGNIKWHVEWRFCLADEEVKLWNRAVSEEDSLGGILETHLSVDLAAEGKLNRLKDFVSAGVAGIQVELLKEGGRDKSTPTSLSLPLKEVLRGNRIVEFPIFLVSLVTKQ